MRTLYHGSLQVTGQIKPLTYDRIWDTRRCKEALWNDVLLQGRMTETVLHIIASFLLTYFYELQDSIGLGLRLDTKHLHGSTSSVN